jgi:hypothetical protein
MCDKNYRSNFSMFIAYSCYYFIFSYWNVGIKFLKRLLQQLLEHALLLKNCMRKLYLCVNVCFTMAKVP